MNYKVLKVSQLKPFKIREIRENVVEEIKERIKEGYNPARPLTVVVVKDNNNNSEDYIVVDGNHRLKALQDLKIEEVPCLVRTGDMYKLAVECNQDEYTYANMDVFDFIELINKMQEEGLSGVDISEILKWSTQKISNYNNIINKISTQFLEIAKKYQVGHVDIKSTNVSFNFTEGWFRNSNLYYLSEQYQLSLIEDFIQDKCRWNNSKVKSESAKYKSWMGFIEIAKDKLVNPNDLEEIVGLIENGVFKNEGQLLNKINDFNEKAENKLICGDCIVEMESLQDGSIDLIITDPPYGIDYSSNRSKFTEHVTKETIANDNDLQQALDLTDKALEILSRKTKENAHLYLFTSWKVYAQFEKIVEKYFSIKNMIVWDKGNHGSGDIEGSWGNRHELIIFATKGNKKLNTRKADIINVSKLSSNNIIHPTQKPVDLIKELLEVSAQSKDTVIDSFMGSGSIIKAVKEYGDLNYIGIELDKERFEKAIAFINQDKNNKLNKISSINNNIQTLFKKDDKIAV